MEGKTYYIEEYSFIGSDNKTYNYRNRTWKLSDCTNDFGDKAKYKGLYEGDYITNTNDIKNLPIYKFNKIWIQEKTHNGYEIIDIGNPLNKELSPFYEMEKTVLKFE